MPITGVNSILATYGMFGWVFTIYRVFTSMVIAMVAGVLTNIFDKTEEVVKPAFSTVNVGNINMTKPSLASTNSFSLSINKEEEIKSCCSSGMVEGKKKVKFSIAKALHYEFLTLLSDISKPLFLGLIIGAVITVAIPRCDVCLCNFISANCRGSDA